LFRQAKPALAALMKDLAALGATLPKVKVRGRLRIKERRKIAFLDTLDHAIAANRFVLRQRIELGGEKEKVEYTLKCRSPDRYVAVGADVRGGGDGKPDVKLEEDIGVPFVSRYSHSGKVKGARRLPKNLRSAAKYFPALGRLERDGQRCRGGLRLAPVNGLRVYERVYAGATVVLAKTKAELAVILWSDGKRGRPLVAELSFRHGVDEQANSRKTALAAMRFFEGLQQLDWCWADTRTKTRFVYREE
jgi:hypothetical protein